MNWAELLPQVVLTGVVVGCFYALVATALQVAFGATRILNFAQGEFAVAGMFALWSLSVGLHLNLWLSLVLVVVIGFIVGVAFEFVAVRPLGGGSEVTAAIATFAGGIALRGIYSLPYGSESRGVPPFLAAGPFTLGSVVVSSQSLVVVVGAVLALVLVYAFQRWTWTGRAMVATAENRNGAAVIGIDPRTMSSLAFGLNGSISALAGALMVPVFGARYDFGLNFALVAFIAGVLGGLTSSVGAATGGLILGIIVSLIAAVFGSGFNATWLLVLLALVLYVRPHGLFGRFAAHA